MPPTLLLIRHAQALHNVASDWSLHDPPLSELGERQCAELQESLKKSKIADEVELVVVSAMRRTLQTASLALGFLIGPEGKGIPVRPDAGWQENADKPCDTGSPISVMEKEFPNFDFSTVDPTYPDKTTNLSSNPYAFTRKAILARGQTCLRDLYSRPEKVIAVVSHSGFLRTAVCHRRFFNADWRVFDFDEEAMKESKGKGEGEFLLKEWKETEENGGGMGRSEKGVVAVLPTDFPPEVEVDGEGAEQVPGEGNEKEVVPQWMRREQFQKEESLSATWRIQPNGVRNLCNSLIIFATPSILFCEFFALFMFFYLWRREDSMHRHRIRDLVANMQARTGHTKTKSPKLALGTSGSSSPSMIFSFDLILILTALQDCRYPRTYHNLQQSRFLTHDNNSSLKLPASRSSRSSQYRFSLRPAALCKR